MARLGWLWNEIRFWILLFFLLRLYGITEPPLEIGHNWRQTTVLMAARNFYEIDNHIAYPRVDFAGEKTGITGMEFPILNYLIYCTALVFGYDHWYGRLINLIISSLGLWFYYQFIKKYFSEKVAFYSTLILASSIWFSFSRKIMPDTFSTSFIIASLYYGTNYLESDQRRLWQLLAYVFCLGVGMMSKIPTGYLLILLCIWFIMPGLPMGRKVLLGFLTGMVLVPVAYWYFVWVPYLVEHYGFWHFFMGKSIPQGAYELGQSVHEAAAKFYDVALKYSGFAMFLFGLFYATFQREKKVILPFLLTFSGFLVIMLKAGFTFSYHNYYIIPFVPVMAFVAGYGLAHLPFVKFQPFLLAFIIIEGILNQQHDFRIKPNEQALLQLESDLDKISQRSDLILINSGENPTPMYFAHRKGWINDNQAIQNSEYIAALKTKGLKFIVILKKAFGSEIHLPSYKKVFENEDYCIYAL